MSELKKVIIKKEGDVWIVTRERETNGESGRFKTLQEAWSFIVAIYGQKVEVESDYIVECERCHMKDNVAFMYTTSQGYFCSECNADLEACYADNFE